MENIHIKYMRDLMKTQGVYVLEATAPYEEIKHFDGGLREQLYVNYDYDIIIKRLNDTKENTIYTLVDSFEVRYVFFKSPSAESTFVLVGPYLSQECKDILGRVSELMKLEPLQIKELKEYYNGIPIFAGSDDPEIRVMVIANYIFGENNFLVDGSSPILMHNPDAYEVRIEFEKMLSYSIIEERYEIEDKMLEAVGKGDLKEAIMLMNHLGKYTIEPRSTDILRNIKNMIITLNTLMRKAVQGAAVHPAYIDNTSAQLANAIEVAVSFNDVARIADEMVRKYCRLVQDHSLMKYSGKMQKVLNYIDFHYTECLALNQLADIAGVGASYLSTQFKKETGLTITEHINQLRVRYSLPLLTTTRLPINLVSERVGFSDYNYFTRVFKKIMVHSPSQYRKMLIL